jgi:Aminotransferase class I and II
MVSKLPRNADLDNLPTQFRRYPRGHRWAEMHCTMQSNYTQVRSGCSAMDYSSKFDSLLCDLKRDGRYRTFIDLERQVGALPTAIWRRPDGAERLVTVWCSNDYLGMGHHPDVLAAMQRTIAETGGGTGGTRNISGHHHAHVLLENELAGLHGKEAALVFTSGWISNLATLGVIGKVLPNCVIFSDALNHNSMIEGIRRSGAERVIFRHNDVAHLDELMSRYDRDRPKLVAFESIYSMMATWLRLPRSAMSPIDITRSPTWTRSMASAFMVRVVAGLPSATASPIASPSSRAHLPKHLA